MVIATEKASAINEALADRILAPLRKITASKNLHA
jgi:hypothetical protein